LSPSAAAGHAHLLAESFYYIRDPANLDVQFYFCRSRALFRRKAPKTLPAQVGNEIPTEPIAAAHSAFPLALFLSSGMSPRRHLARADFVKKITRIKAATRN